MALDIAMGGSTTTVLHILAAAHEGGVDFTMAEIDRLSRHVPVRYKVATAEPRARKASDALRAYALFATPAATGAMRQLPDLAPVSRIWYRWVGGTAPPKMPVVISARFPTPD